MIKWHQTNNTFIRSPLSSQQPLSRVSFVGQAERCPPLKLQLYFRSLFISLIVLQQMCQSGDATTNRCWISVGGAHRSRLQALVVIVVVVNDPAAATVARSAHCSNVIKIKFGREPIEGQ